MEHGPLWLQGSGSDYSAKDFRHIIRELVYETRFYKVPILNWILILAYACAILYLSLRFKTWYAISSLGTTALTNLTLFGLSDILAQTLCNVTNWQPLEDTHESAFFSYIYDKGRRRRINLDAEEDDLESLGLAFPSNATDELPEESVSPSYFDFRRLALFSLWGFSISVVQSPWYYFLRAAYSRDAKLIVVVQRVLADQLFYSPIMLFAFLSYLSYVVQNGSLESVKETLMTRYVPTLGINFCVWPIAQFVNFLLIPPAVQIPFSASISVVWNTYLSLNSR